MKKNEDFLLDQERKTIRKIPCFPFAFLNRVEFLFFPRNEKKQTNKSCEGRDEHQPRTKTRNSSTNKLRLHKYNNNESTVCCMYTKLIIEIPTAQCLREKRGRQSSSLSKSTITKTNSYLTTTTMAKVQKLIKNLCKSAANLTSQKGKPHQIIGFSLSLGDSFQTENRAETTRKTTFSSILKKINLGHFTKKQAR